MTDKLKPSQMMNKVFVYVNSLARELRKVLQDKFEHEHKGMSLDTVESALRGEVEKWINTRDKNTKLTHMKTTKGKSGEVTLYYSGQTKDAAFKLIVNAFFTLVQAHDKLITYLKAIQITVDKRDIVLD